MTEREATDKAINMFAAWDKFNFEARCANAVEFCTSFAEIQDLLSASLYLKVLSFCGEAQEYYLPKLWA